MKTVPLQGLKSIGVMTTRRTRAPAGVTDFEGLVMQSGHSFVRPLLALAKSKKHFIGVVWVDGANSDGY